LVATAVVTSRGLGVSRPTTNINVNGLARGYSYCSYCFAAVSTAVVVIGIAASFGTFHINGDGENACRNGPTLLTAGIIEGGSCRWV
jgi:hypothetical protein